MNRSIVILPGFLLVALLLTVVYAMLGLRGPEAVLREARRALDLEQYDKSIRLLDAAAAALGDNRAGLLEQTLRMRVAAYEHLGLREKVLEDLDTLFTKLSVRDRDLMCTRIRMHNELAAELDDDASRDRARDLCAKWLAAHPDDPYVLAQAGLSRDLESDQQFSKWFAETRAQTPLDHHDRLRAEMEVAVYSVADGRVHENQVHTLTEELEKVTPGLSEDTAATLRRIREPVLAARRFYLMSLGTGHCIPLAYEGIARQLRKAGEDDTLLMIAHSFLRCATPGAGLIAAVDIADVHLRHHRLQAALAVAEQALPVGSLSRRYLDGQLNRHAMRLLFCRALALELSREPGAAAERRRLRADLSDLLKNREAEVVRALAATPLKDIVLGLLQDDPGRRRAHLVNFTNSEAARRYPWNGKLLQDTAYRALVKVCNDAEKSLIIENWIRAVPGEVGPIYALARFETRRGSAGHASSLLEHALRTLPHKDQTLELLVAAQATTFKEDLDEVIQRAAELANSVPDEIRSFPALTIAAARRALQLESFGVALGCCDRARELYPDARLPVYLKAKILLAMEKPEEAGRVMSILLEEDPSDREALKLLMRARAAAGKTTDDLRFESLLRGTPDLDSTRFLARHWLARKELGRVTMLTQLATGPDQYGDDLELHVLATRACLLDPDADPKKVDSMVRKVYELTRGKEAVSPRERKLELWALYQYVLHNPDKEDPEALAALLEQFLAENESGEQLEELAAGLAEEGVPELAFRAYTALTTQDRYKDHRKGEHLVAAGRLALRMNLIPKAKGLFQAALSFPDSGAAVLELAMLAKLQGEDFEFPEPPKVDSIRAAFLTPDRDAAISWLKEQQAANPHDLAAQCLLAGFGVEAELSVAVTALANIVGDELVLLTALLDDDTYTDAAQHRLDALREKYRENEVLYVLQARVSAYTGDYEQVRYNLSKAGKSLLDDTTLKAEALNILASCDSPLIRNSKIMTHLLGMALAQGSETPPALMATLLRYNAALLELPGIRNKVMPVVAGFWLKYPELAGAGLREAALLAESGYLFKAVLLLGTIEKKLPAEERSDFLELYYSTMSRLAEVANPPDRVQMLKSAIKILRTECVHGAPLHLCLQLLDREVKQLGDTPAGAEARRRMLSVESEYLLRHVDYFLAGHDKNVENLVLTLRRLGRREGFERGLQKIDEVLRKDPSLLRVWLLRADWLVQLDRVDEAVVSLVWLPRYLKDPMIIDALVELMGRSGILVQKGLDFLELDELATTSKFSLGMVLLRLGHYPRSAGAFELARPHPDGLHLYYRAMALLGTQADEQAAEARRLLVEIVQRYPESSFAQSARTVVQVL